MLNQEGCPKHVLAMRDAIEIVESRWKLPILIALSSSGKRFSQIAKEVDGISDKMLSKELKALETNKLVKREVFDNSSPTIEYSITVHGKSLENLMKELYHWGMEHRKQMIGSSF